MEQNNNKKIMAIVIGIITLVLIAGGFYYSYKANRENKEVFNPKEESTRGIDNMMQTVDVKHQFRNGTHTFAGEIVLPTPCDSVEVKAEKDAVDQSRVVLAFATSNTSEVCAEVISSRRFKTTIDGVKDIKISGTLNGEEIILNVFEVPQDENLDTFEIYIKG